MSRGNSIQYGFNREGLYARCGERVAFTALDFEHMKPENGFEARYSIEEGEAYKVLPHLGKVFWTKKVPISIKNAFRKHFGLKPLKDNGEQVLLGGMTHDQFLCKEAREASKNNGHEMKPFKKIESGRVCYEATCKKCGCHVFVNPSPRPNEIDISGDVFSNICK